MIVVQHRMD